MPTRVETLEEAELLYGKSVPGSDLEKFYLAERERFCELLAEQLYAEKDYEALERLLGRCPVDGKTFEFICSLFGP